MSIAYYDEDIENSYPEEDSVEELLLGLLETKLKDKDREIIALRYYELMTVIEIARDIDMTRDAVYKRLEKSKILLLKEFMALKAKILKEYSGTRLEAYLKKVYNVPIEPY